MTSADRNSHRWPDTLIAAALALLAFLLYVPTLSYGLLDFDDLHQLNHPMVAGGLTIKGILWAFTTTTDCKWFPLTWLSHMLDVQMFGRNWGGHHASSVALHAINSALVFAVLRMMTEFRWRAATVASIFAVHPLRVESVTWIAERTGILSATFCLSVLLIYAWYARQPSLWRYVLVVIAYAAALMAKPTAVTLPLVLLLLDYWPLNRLRSATSNAWTRRVIEKVPLLALAGVITLLTLLAQQHCGAQNLAGDLTLGRRLANAAVSIPRYLFKTVWPVELSIYYPYPASWSAYTVVASLTLIVLLTVVTLYAARRRPYLCVGWLWFLAMLLPVLGIVQVGLHAMADRYMYLPIIGLLIMIVWGAADMAKRVGAGAPSVTTLVSIVLIILSIFTWYQQSFWRDSYALFTHALAIDPNNSFAEFVVGNALSDAGDDVRALERYERALALDPRDPMFHYRSAMSLGRLGQIDHAIAQFQEALRLRPQWATAHEMLARAYLLRGDQGAAQTHFDQARQIEQNISGMNE